MAYLYKEKSLIGIPYKEQNCWDLIVNFHNIKIDKVSTVRSIDKYFLRKEASKLFKPIKSDELLHGDVVLHSTHIALIIIDKSTNTYGFIHAIEPYSEFIPVDTEKDLFKGLNNSNIIYSAPTFWRIIK